MSKLATENWDKREFQRGARARRQFLVTGATDEADAIATTPIPQKGDEFVLDDRLIAAEPVASSPNQAETYTVDVEFTLPTSSGGGGGGNIDLPPEYFPQISEDSEPTDVAYDDNDNQVPIVNSARDATKTLPTKPGDKVSYVYKRWESTFDGPRALAYRGKINSDEFNLPGFGTVEIGKARCVSINVGNSFNRDSTEVQVVYNFELREEGFKARILDQGTRAIVTTSAGQVAGQLFDKASGSKITYDVLLNGGGNPIDVDSYVVKDSQGNELDQVGLDPPAGAEVETTDHATFLKYRLSKLIAFAGLTLTD